MFHKHYISPFAADSVCGVTGLAYTKCSSLHVSSPFLPDIPGFHFSSDSVIPSQLGSSSRAIPPKLISGTTLMFSVTFLLFTCPTHYILIMSITGGSTLASSNISSFHLSCSSRLTFIANFTINRNTLYLCCRTNNKTHILDL